MDSPTDSVQNFFSCTQLHMTKRTEESTVTANDVWPNKVTGTLSIKTSACYHFRWSGEIDRAELDVPQGGQDTWLSEEKSVGGNAMPVVIRGEKVSEVEVGHCQVTALLTRESIGNDQVELDHISLNKDACFNIDLDDAAAGWVQILTGCGEMDGATEQLTPNHIAYLPLGYSDGFTAAEESTRILLARIPEAARFDDAIADMPTTPQSVDWTREPVLQSEHDARSRIYMATRTLAGTDAFKGEMITYPPGTAGSAHHHEGAEHFKYVISGQGTALLNGEEIPLKAGDVIYNYEHEIHSSINESKEDFVFVEFFIPGPCKTVWVPGANRCAWLPTGVDNQGRKPVREIGYHVHGQEGGI